MELDAATSILGGIIAVVMALYTFATYWIQRRREQRRRSTDLHSTFYSGDNYRYCVLPVYRLIVKLRGLPQRKRDEYMAVIAQGWAFDPDPVSDYDNFISEREQDCEAAEAHYRLHHSTEEYTEHDALTAFLYFWVRVARLVEAGLIDEELFGKLFCNSFLYYDQFLDDLREAVRAINPDGQEPAWVAATEQVEEMVSKSQ